MKPEAAKKMLLQITNSHTVGKYEQCLVKELKSLFKVPLSQGLLGIIVIDRGKHTSG